VEEQDRTNAPVPGLVKRFADWVFSRGELAKAQAIQPLTKEQQLWFERGRYLTTSAMGLRDDRGEDEESPWSADAVIALEREAFTSFARASMLAESDPPPPSTTEGLWARLEQEGAFSGVAEPVRTKAREVLTNAVVSPAPSPVPPDGEQRGAAQALVAHLASALGDRVKPIERAKRRRAIRVAGVSGAVVAVVALGGASLLSWLDEIRDPNLLRRATWTVSSTFNEQIPAQGKGFAKPFAPREYFFATQKQDSPYIEFDLGKETNMHVVAVENLHKCCQMDAVPLVVEVAGNDHQLTEVGRRAEVFERWEATFPPRTVRYVRLSVAKNTTFYLVKAEAY
jgi:hypothetical protein